MINSIITGLIAGLIAPLFLAWLQHKIIWQEQKRNEIRMKIFLDTLTAFSSYEADALNVDLQLTNKPYGGHHFKTKLRPETIILQGQVLGTVKAFFSNETFLKVDKTLKEKISIENTPNGEFGEIRNKAILAMASELGIIDSLLERIKNIFKK